MDDLGSNGVVIADKIEPSYLVPLGRRDEGLGCQQVGLPRKRAALRERKLESSAIIERVAGGCGKARVPHEPGKEGGIDDHWRAAHIARSGAVRPHDLIAVDADRDGLGIAKTSGRRVATCTGVVVI